MMCECQASDHKADFQDKGSLIEVKFPVDHAVEKVVEVTCTADSLTVLQRGVNDPLLFVEQLWGTIDAGKTEWDVSKGVLRVTLQKLEPQTVWEQLQVEEVAEAKSVSPLEEDEGTAGAMAAREQVGKLLTAAQAGDLKQLQAVAPSFGVGGVKDVKDGNGRTALHFAAQAGQASTASYLIDEEKLDVNQQDDKGETPLGLAAGSGSLQIIILLLEKGADVCTTSGSTPQPIHRAAGAGSVAVVTALLEAGADLEAHSETGMPLHWAAGSSRLENLEALLAAGAEPNARTAEGVTATLMAAAIGSTETIQALARHGADMSLAASGGVTPLHAAAEIGALPTVKALLEAGANPDAEDETGAKAIHAAAAAGNEGVVRLLLPHTQRGGAQKWTVEDLLADSSSLETSSGQPSPEKDELEKIPEPDEYDVEKAGSCKREGDEAFVRRDFGVAVSAYTQSLSHDTHNHLVWANRSAANLRQGHAAAALSDARTARAIKPDYLKAWYREGEAAKALQQWEDAAQAYYQAFTLDPSNTDMAHAFQHAIAQGKAEYAARQAGS